MIQHTDNGRPIESRTWSIERCHFQWPWTTQTKISKSHHSLTPNISEMVWDSYNEILTDLRLIHMRHFEWLWVTLRSSNDLAKYSMYEAKHCTVSLRQLSFLFYRLFKETKGSLFWTQCSIEMLGGTFQRAVRERRWEKPKDEHWADKTRPTRVTVETVHQAGTAVYTVSTKKTKPENF